MPNSNDAERHEHATPSETGMQLLNYDDDRPVPSGGAHIEPIEMEPNTQIDQPQQLCRLNCISVPTYKVNPDNAPPSRTERAVQESKEAANRTQASCTERKAARSGMGAGTDQMDNVGAPPNQELAALYMGANQTQGVPDLANIASMKKLAYLLNAMEEF
ncbi:hypothetical protein C0995_007253 [Termitomyces sp. Mi166|nr:hypothetical protein C0995_007253 [Termitomyces sp. Mi166\